MGYRVRTGSFEGPFDLLVYLIESSEMSVYDVRISEITSEYLAFVKKLEEADVMDTAEFMVLAATLIEIKSKLMLPSLAINDENDGEEMRDDLISMLIEYKKIKSRARLLANALYEGSLIFEKPSEDINAYKEVPEELLIMDTEEFMLAFSNFIYKKKKDIELANIQERIAREALTLDRKKEMIRNKLSALMASQEIYFKDLVLAKDSKKEQVYDEVLTFMSILDLSREGEMKTEQKYNFADIRIFKGEEETAPLATTGAQYE